jgi:cytochrome P450
VWGTVGRVSVVKPTRDRETTGAPRRGPVGSGRAGERPPGPRGLPLVGSGLAFQRDPLGRFREWLDTYGDVVHYHVGGPPLYVLGHPDDIQSVLVGEHQRYMKDELVHELSRFIGRGLLTSEGSAWRRHRRIIAPTFQRRHVASLGDSMVERTLVAIESFGDDEVRDLHADMMVLTLDIVLHTLFGAASIPDMHTVSEVLDVFMEEFQSTGLSWRRMLPAAFHRESDARIADATEKLDAILYGIIRERRQGGVAGDDLLGRLLDARDDDGTGMGERQLRDEVATIFLAGHETTAIALTYTFFLLAQHPRVQRKLQDEVDRVLAKRRAGSADVPALPYADAVMRESMRLYPPAYIIGREALEDRTIGGWVIPRGAQVLMPQWAVHRDARWFDEPDEFRPERWLDGLAERLPRFAYYPFGGGARICVGNHFAMLESVLALATIVQHIEVVIDPTFRLALAPSVTLRPHDGVRLRIRRRHPAED